ncbi:hypothetical protein CNMCM8980_002355 [Aspergillus fumigatiaffinis]|nr:hypothetical protein CNMCM8980_002355 [Aspergillus fumigatiaffinis]
MEARPSLSYDDYTVGWICALSLEAAAAKLMLDEIHPPLPRLLKDQNTYILGSIGKHNIVIASLPSGAYGTTSAATVAMQLLSTFPAVRFGLMVGIGGGVPNKTTDIRLGDIVVSQPTDTSGGVIQYDLGKAFNGGLFKRTGMLNRPPKVLLTALATLQAHHLTEDSRIIQFLSNMQANIAPHKARKFARPTQEDQLFYGEYDHVGSDTCISCDRTKLVIRHPREREEPVIHYGLIGSANQVMKDGRRRDQLAQDLGIYCVDMEVAGLMNDFPCLVIRGICDYADSHKNKEWQGYAAVVAAAYAKELLLVIPADPVHSTLSTPAVLTNSDDRFDVPFDLTDVPVIENFLGRQGELDRLWQYLQPASSQSQKVAVLHGLGGIGKTQLAIRFARDHKDDFTAILWLSGKNRGALVQSLSSAFCRLPGQSQNADATTAEEVEHQAKNVLHWLELKGNSRWLLIFDNIDQYSPSVSPVCDAYDIARFFPAADHGSILITSRLLKTTELGKPFLIQRLDANDAIQLLLQSSRLSARSTLQELERDPDTHALMTRLDGLPLAIAIAGAFMRETGTSIAEYLQYYLESWSDLQLQPNPERQYQQGNILQTWTVSYCEIQKRDPNAALLLLLLARYDNRDICGLAFKVGVKLLVGFALLEPKGDDGSYAMHPVVQDWCIHLASTDESVDSSHLDESALISVGFAVPDLSDKNYFQLQRRLLPHVNHVRNTYWRGQNIAMLGAFDGIGDLYMDQVLLKDAEEMYRRALVGKETIFGPDHSSTLDTVNNLGLLYQSQGKLKEAEAMYQRALVGKEKIFGPDHISTLNTVTNLGLLYRNQGKLMEAEEMYQQALAGKRKALSPDHTSTLNIVNNLGVLYGNQGKLTEAEEMFQQALAGFQKTLGPDHISTLDTVNNLGVVYFDQGKLTAAEEMYQQALVGKEKALGPDHISTLDTVNNLGNLYFHQEKMMEAEEMYQRALVGKEKSLGCDHMSTLATVNNLGVLYWNQGKLTVAEEMYQRALVGKEKALGPNHISTLDTVHNLGNLYFHQEKMMEAEEMYQRALVSKEKALGSDHTSTLTTVNGLGVLYMSQGKLREAEEMYQEALAGFEKALSPDHIFTLTIVNNLGRLYTMQGKLKEADEMYQRTQAGSEKVPGPGPATRREVV